MALNAPYTPNTVIQSTQVSNDLIGLANGTNDTTNNSMSTFRSDVVFDHVASGCVWSGDSYAVTRNASQTAGVVYISGVRLTVSAVSARLFTASVDTYIDVNGSGVQVYTEVSNNAASAALTAGNIRIGIIVTGATTIAAATSVNQGQESRVLPIASSVAYSVQDSLGNLICPRDPNRKVLGYRQIIAAISAVATSTSDIDLTGLSCPVIVPTGRKIVAKGFGAYQQTGGIGTVYAGFKIKESATQFSSFSVVPSVANIDHLAVTEATITSSAGSHTYKLSLANNSTGPNFTFDAAGTAPAFIRIDLA